MEPTRRKIARAFARDCAVLMSRSVGKLPRGELRAMARRFVERTQVPALPQATNALAARLELAEGAHWNPYWPPFQQVCAALEHLQHFLVREVVPRLKNPEGFFAGEAERPVRVVVEEARALLDEERIPASGRTIRYPKRHATPFAVIPASGARFDLRNALYSSEPALAVHGAIMTLQSWPWTRCEGCKRVFAPGRYGARFCSTKCRGADAYAQHRKQIEAMSPRQLHDYRRAKSDAVLRIYNEKQAGTWVRQRRPGAGRPRKAVKKGG